MVPREATAVWAAHHTVEEAPIMVKDLHLAGSVQAEAIRRAEATTVAKAARAAEEVTVRKERKADRAR